MGPIRNPNWSTSGMRVTLSYLGRVVYRTTSLLSIPEDNGQCNIYVDGLE